MAMSEREHHIKVLEKMFYGMEKLENGVILPTSEVKTALAYAISSLKTDLKYDLMYEGEEVYTKDDLVATLKEIQDKIFNESWRLECICDDLDGSAVDWDDISKIIQQKIEELKK